MKKIFSILLSLAMLVSLGALTAAPVSAANEVLPQLAPDSGTFDLCNPCGVATTIIWGDATSVTDVEDITQTSLPAGNWSVFGCLLVISDDYLQSVLLDGGDSVTLIVVFDLGKAFFTITATCEDAEAVPSSRNWVFDSPDSANTTIVTCCGNNVTGIAYYDAAGREDLVFNTDYDVDVNADCSLNLSIANSWLANELWCVGASVKLDIDMLWCENVTFTITAVAAPLPGVSPQALSYSICCRPEYTNCCCYNVCTTIDWADATSIVSISDVTNQQMVLPLYQNLNWWLKDNDTLVIGGCPSTTYPGSIWGGLGCNLDAGSRLARLLAINFNDACNTTVILTVNSAGYTLPSITPTDIVVDLDLWKSDPLRATTSYSGAVVSLGTATGIANVTDITLDECTGTLVHPPTGLVLTPALNWMFAYAPAYGGYLFLIFRSYLESPSGGNMTKCGDQVKLLIKWLPDNRPFCSATGYIYPYQYLPTTITVTATGVGASVCPTSAEFNLDSPADVETEVTWGNWATNITDIWATKCSIPVLEWGVDYTLEPTPGDCETPSVLTIKASYLAKVLTEVDDSIVLTIKFDTCDDAKLTITATGTKACFIATAAGADAPQLDILRDFRDKVLRPNAPWLVSLYYEVSPSIAKVIAGNEALKCLVKEAFVDPIVDIVQLVMG